MPGKGKSRPKTKKKPKTRAGPKSAERARGIKEMRAGLIERREAILSGMEHKLRYRSTPSTTKGDSSDLAAEALDSDTAMRLAESDSSELAGIEKALQSFEGGTYGQCESCGEDIPWPRLKALPYATLCVKCKEREETTGSEGTSPAGWSAVDEFASLDSD